MSDYRFQIGDKVQRRFAGSNGQHWQNVTITDTDPCGRVLEYRFDDPTCVEIKAYNDDFRPRTVAPDPYALYPTTGDMSPREQHDADSALITEGKVWAASGMPSLGFQRFIKINGALYRNIDWLKAQLAALRGEE